MAQVQSASEGETVTFELDLSKKELVLKCAEILHKLGYKVVDVQIFPPPDVIAKVTVAKDKA
jgi:hypothetical protein